MEQNTKEWLAWRRKGIGASDAAIVLNKSPWGTPYKLWLQKIGLGAEQEDNVAMAFGKAFEPKARSNVCLDKGLDFKDTLVEHDKYPFLRASLDGYDEEARSILEIKYVGKEKFEKAKAGEIPEHYRIQMDHQFMVSGCTRGFYSCFVLSPDKKEIADQHTIAVEPRIEFIQKELLPAEIKFWDLVEKKIPPEFTQKDEILVESRQHELAAKRYLELQEEIKAKEAELSIVKSTLQELNEKAFIVKCGPLKIQRIFRKGAVDYKAIPELQGVDLERYRKGDCEYTRIDLIK